MKKKNSKNKSVKKTTVKKTVTKVQKIAESPLNVRFAVSDLKKLYRELDKVNAKKASLLEQIAKQESKCEEVFDLNLAKIDEAEKTKEESFKTASVQSPKTTIGSFPSIPMRKDQLTGQPRLVSVATKSCIPASCCGVRI